MLSLTLVIAVIALLGVTRLAVSLAVEVRNVALATDIDPRVNLRNYDNVSWARDFWTEYNELEFQFTSFDLYERADFSGNAIRIVDSFRHTTDTRSATQNLSNFEVRLFGGSTAWGFGVDDRHTIPSLINDIGGFKSKNFGRGFVARQELARLINMYTEADTIGEPLKPGTIFL